MEVTEEGGHVEEHRQVEHESCCHVLDALQMLDRGGRESSQEQVAVVEAGDDECLDQELRESKSAGLGHRCDGGCAAQLVIQYDAKVPGSW